jgi:hypothetical protein
MGGSEKLKLFLTEVSAQHYLQPQLQSSLTSANRYGRSLLALCLQKAARPMPSIMQDASS